jgi:hypothetical protein
MCFVKDMRPAIRISTATWNFICLEKKSERELLLSVYFTELGTNITIYILNNLKLYSCKLLRYKLDPIMYNIRYKSSVVTSHLTYGST